MDWIKCSVRNIQKINDYNKKKTLKFGEYSDWNIVSITMKIRSKVYIYKYGILIGFYLRALRICSPEYIHEKEEYKKNTFKLQHS